MMTVHAEKRQFMKVDFYGSVGSSLWDYWLEVKDSDNADELFSKRFEAMYPVIRSTYSANTLMNGGIKKIRSEMLKKSTLSADYESIKGLQPFSLIKLSQADYEGIQAANQKSMSKVAYSIQPEHLEFWQKYCETVVNADVLTVRDAIQVFCVAMLCTGKRANEIIWTSFFEPVEPDSRFMNFAGQSKIKASQGDLMVEGRLYCLFVNADKLYSVLEIARKIVKGSTRLSPDTTIEELQDLPELTTEKQRDKWLDMNKRVFYSTIKDMFSCIVTEFEEGDKAGLDKGDKMSIARKIYFNLMVACHERLAIGQPRTSDFLSGLYLNHLGEGSSQNYQRCYVRADATLAINPVDRFWKLGSPLG